MKSYIIKILNKIEEEGRQKVFWSKNEREEREGYGMMDAVQMIKNKLNIK